jgi:hypothetical protein
MYVSVDANLESVYDQKWLDPGSLILRLLLLTRHHDGQVDPLEDEARVPTQKARGLRLCCDRRSPAGTAERKASERRGCTGRGRRRGACCGRGSCGWRGRGDYCH